jgi:hypothetical protein
MSGCLFSISCTEQATSGHSSRKDNRESTHHQLVHSLSEAAKDHTSRYAVLSALTADSLGFQVIAQLQE